MSTPSTPSATGRHTAPRNDFADLAHLVRRAGLLDRRYGYYAAKISITLLVFAGGCVAFAVLGDSWWQLATAVFFAVMFAQIAFLGHDAGHKQIFRTRRANDVLGYAFGGIVGISYGWWMGTHTRHHANPNHEDEDPDLDIPLLAFTHGQSRNRRGLVRWTAKHQAALFFPLLLLEGLSLHWASIQAVWRGEVKDRRIETVLLGAHIAGYLTVVFLVLSPPVAIAFIAVHQGLWGVYMGCSFAPGHKGMPTYTDASTLDFLRKQVLTSRNVCGGRWVDVALGGLNYQIEHHLFPTMPRVNLRRAQPVVREFCTQRGIDYAQCGLMRTYRYVLQHFHDVSAPLRALARSTR
ncbi:fatty acid desaturase family protein [Kibdelosporangium phytohabitans]|uniref:Delta fatty acid desaturase n=1 Tax=Kibdelosporangium phytohabitans TaxID=860235 RepID=A0A0N7F2M9_9PSEU|nr:acyl-CoA desaturase [Kibdelosporangium phytohabitans]ALG06279.1 delta fatty acid desaturase [Kibdelosporangium phytohabitans]MBE1467383.1 fatty acid desaturase [Kibdelosporangium phytohabitans]